MVAISLSEDYAAIGGYEEANIQSKFEDERFEELFDAHAMMMVAPIKSEILIQLNNKYREIIWEYFGIVFSFFL